VSSSGQFNYSFQQLGEAFYARIQPTPLTVGRVLHINQTLFAEMDLPDKFLVELPDLMALRKLPDWVQPVAMVYSGHQFGSYNPRLGDGRGILLAQWQHGGQEWDLHLKGAGMTPFSRMGDGRAVLRSSIREYLASEALHQLGIPSTRALAVATTPDPVIREKVESGATLLRVTPSHIRFGHFEYFAYTGQGEQLKALLHYVMQRYWPTLATDDYGGWFKDVVRRNAVLVAKWQAFGFAHGVLNTDNMSILGETFDFGPYAFINEYDPDFICNHSDDAGRYRFGRQPDIVYWNLLCLAQALSSLIDVALLKEAMSDFAGIFWQHYRGLMAGRLGFSASNDQVADLCDRYLALLAEQKVDYHLAFYRLADALEGDESGWLSLFCDILSAKSWITEYRAIIAGSGRDAYENPVIIRACVPAFVLRNYIVQNVISECELGDDSLLEQVFSYLQKPFAPAEDFAEMAAEVPEWGRHICISCSS
jgi:serine/tyrosine/threonine adenylyltransferase